MNKIIRGLLSISMAAVLACFATSASATGLYIGAGLYQADFDSGSDDDNDTVPAGFVGYQFIDTNLLMVSAELGYYDLGDYSGNYLGNTWSAEAEAMTLAGVVYFPIGPFFEIYGKAGIASTSIDAKINGVKFSDDSDDAFGGVGFSFDILDTIDIYAEYLVFDNEADSEVMGVGIRLDF